MFYIFFQFKTGCAFKFTLSSILCWRSITKGTAFCADASHDNWRMLCSLLSCLFLCLYFCLLCQTCSQTACCLQARHNMTVAKKCANSQMYFVFVRIIFDTAIIHIQLIKRLRRNWVVFVKVEKRCFFYERLSSVDSLRANSNCLLSFTKKTLKYQPKHVHCGFMVVTQQRLCYLGFIEYCLWYLKILCQTGKLLCLGAHLTLHFVLFIFYMLSNDIYVIMMKKWFFVVFMK